MRNALKAVLVVVALSGCGGMEQEEAPAEAPIQTEESAATNPTYTQASWVDETTCVAGVLGGRWVTSAGVSPPALLGTIPASCCPAVKKAYPATCNCPQHGATTACDVVVAADCTATLVGHSEYNESVTLKF